MKVAYFDCFSVISGDMILGALFDLGIDVDFFKNEIEKLNLTGYSIDVKKVKKNKYEATDVDIIVSEDQPHRTLKDINFLIENSSLDTDVKSLSKKIFYNLAVAEAKVHKMDVEKVHFHEVGAVDSIIDIVGTAIGLKYFKIEDIFCSDLPLGSGYVICQHGKISVPAPATKELIKNIPTYPLDSGHEMITPTGVAVIKTVCSDFIDKPDMFDEKVGFGSGKIKSNQPGVLKIIIGQKKE